MSEPNTQVARQVNAIFVELFEVPESALKPDANLFTDLGLDSLDAIDLMITFENRFHVKLDKSAASHIRTMTDVYDLVLKHAPCEVVQ